MRWPQVTGAHVRGNRTDIQHFSSQLRESAVVTATEPLVLPGALTLVLDTAAGSIAGCRAENQDAALAAPRLAAVTDGVGGSAGGAVAASLVIDRLHRSVQRAGQDAPDLAGAVAAAADDLAAAIAGNRALTGMATTLTAVALTPEGRLVVAHVGDSRAYLLRRGGLARLTTDQTLVQSLVDAGTITPEEARSHPLRSLVFAALRGRPEDVADVELSAVPVEPGDRLLLCTDGLSGAVDEATLRSLLTAEAPPADTVPRLLDAALAGASTDNVTAVVADVRAVAGGRLAPAVRVGAAG